MPQLSAYDKEREANIARNKALLQQLDIKQAVSDLDLPAKQTTTTKSRAKPVQPSKKRQIKKEVEEPVRRSSRRLTRSQAAVDPNETPQERKKREAAIAEAQAREAELEIEREEAARLAKRPRHNELDLEILVGDDEDAKKEIPALRTTVFLPATSQVFSKGIGDLDAWAFPESKKHERAVKELQDQMEDLKVVSRAKVTQDRIYSAAYHPEPTKDLVFFGDKHGQLGIWDARASPEDAGDDEEDTGESSDQKEGGKYWRFQVHWPATSKSSISAIRFNPVNSHNVYTSSYDQTIRSLSFTSGISTEVFSTEDSGELPTSMDLTPDGHVMWVSDTGGAITHLDFREGPSQSRRYTVSGKKVGCVSVNPTNPHFLLTASNSKILRIWDIRKLLTMPSDLAIESDDDSSPLNFAEDDIQTYAQSAKGKGIDRGSWKHGQSVSSAYWDPSGRRVISTSYDDTLRLWDFNPPVFSQAKEFPSLRPIHERTHDCQTGRWLTVLKAQWSPNPDVYPHFTVGNMKHSVDIFSCKGDVVARLVDPKRITAVQAVTCSHPSVVQRVASGNGSGRCVLWAPESVAD